MFKLKTNKKGFTLIELVVAMGLLAILAGFVLVSISAIPQTRMTEVAQTIKSEFELTRNFAKTHGGQVNLSIAIVEDGLLLTRSGENIEPETYMCTDPNIEVYYQLASSDLNQYNLGNGAQHALLTDPSVLTVGFEQTSGAIIGPHKINYLILSNGSKNYKLLFQHESGMVYFDYEIEDKDDFKMNDNSTKNISVDPPKFIQNGAFLDSVSIPAKVNKDGEQVSVQPEINYDSRYIKIGGEYRAIEAGRQYTITFTLKDPSSMSWSDGYANPTRSLYWHIP